MILNSTRAIGSNLIVQISLQTVASYDAIVERYAADVC